MYQLPIFDDSNDTLRSMDCYYKDDLRFIVMKIIGGFIIGFLLLTDVNLITDIIIK